ncbi:MAG: hypothetical protein KatS3mg096_876 [Candidatus Parcubacteria bacterium]|nr:MAG: hypothetical protein KatS3mg096_876 [Candidatus Parcubacteria bacterium]
MIGKKVLILGSRSFAASGLYELLHNTRFEVTCFNRGDEAINGDFVSGDVLELSKNKYLNKNFDVVINYIILKDQSVQSNINFIKEVVKFCKNNHVKHLIQISSISVYPNDATIINEYSDIEKNPDLKGNYSKVKIAVDNYLMNLEEDFLNISFIRPGFIIADKNKISTAGIFKRLPFGINILLGNKTTILPTTNRDLLHQAILKILNSDSFEPVYLILSDPNYTKYRFVKDLQIQRVIVLPKAVTLFTAKFLLQIKLLNKTQFNQIAGLFKSTHFDCSITQKKLKMNFNQI